MKCTFESKLTTYHTATIDVSEEEVMQSLTAFYDRNPGLTRSFTPEDLQEWANEVAYDKYFELPEVLAAEEVEVYESCWY